MPSEPVPAAADLRRLHPSSLIFSIGSAARRLLLPGILLLFAAAPPTPTAIPEPPAVTGPKPEAVAKRPELPGFKKGVKLVISAEGIEIDNGQGASIKLAGPKVTVNQGALEVI